MRDVNNKTLKRRLLSCVALGAMAANVAAPVAASAANGTLTPIKHVIVIVGENRTFDHLFATYKPVNAGEKVLNLLSEKIVKADGTPGPNYGEALQYQAFDLGKYQLTPPKSPYVVLPPALSGGGASNGSPSVCVGINPSFSGTSCVTPANLAIARQLENGLADDYYQYLLTGGTGQPSGQPDTRIHYDGHDASSLPPGPYQITSKTYPYDAYAASPVHRFYQMFQQLDCAAQASSKGNGWGCQSDLFAWVEQTVSAGSNGKARPVGYAGEGSTAMGFFNVQQGDVPYLKQLADTYTMSDNYHQPFKGGTGANSYMLGTADPLWFSDGKGNPATPPHNPVNPQMPGTPVIGHTSALSEIENPDPQPGTNNFYKQDGYGGGSGSPTAVAPNANYGGGSYTDCSIANAPGVPPILNYLNSLDRKVNPNCEPNHYYLLNNYNPGYFGDGSNAYTDTNPNNYVFTIPPSSVRNIGDVLNDNKISWAYYGDQFNRYLNDPYDISPEDAYCNICNWAQYSTSIMTNKAKREKHLKDAADFYQAIEACTKGDCTLPAVSYVKPSGFVDGHPGSSKFDLYEGFVKKIVDLVKANPTLWANTAIMITVDEGGGYYDSGPVQPLDYFGDGTRIPMIVVSKYSTGGHISHSYTDHVSTLKFIEANWGLGPITTRSRDNLPNPLTKSDPYIPVNSPAIGDMMDMFDFNH